MSGSIAVIDDKTGKTVTGKPVGGGKDAQGAGCSGGCCGQAAGGCGCSGGCCGAAQGIPSTGGADTRQE